jgi:hypothetical protein
MLIVLLIIYILVIIHVHQSERFIHFNGAFVSHIEFNVLKNTLEVYLLIRK